MRALLLAGLLAAMPAAAQCTAGSGPRTAALVELYTSEGCSSCPPADRWLSGLQGRFAPGAVVPIALHVDYWDYIGWKDPYGKREHSVRQRRLSQLQRLAFVYTPQVLLQGRDFRAWYAKGFDETVARINSQPARAHIRLTLIAAGPQGLEVEARSELVGDAGDPALYLAAYQSRLESRVDAGENRGRLLRHDHVVLEWQGPFGFSGRSAMSERRKMPLLPGADPAHSGVAAFVQDRRSGEVLQALLRPAC
jgi:hypothetical protein